MTVEQLQSLSQPCRVIEQKGNTVTVLCGGVVLNPELREVGLWRSEDLAIAGMIFTLVVISAVFKGRHNGRA